MVPVYHWEIVELYGGFSISWGNSTGYGGSLLSQGYSSWVGGFIPITRVYKTDIMVHYCHRNISV